ncbi:putative septum site-determining protein MinC [Caloramator mitchellensis]|uniref:Probable septum site-determining protein MinC n=1 Tax=Caloramator mitchellensis TaxID=908809 RepID=A0A0R3JXA3_CALMK|nr:septum site-determining protein MinC [Caloramator mitchellensis]KRQ88145.1 putative septum site-determining protein MinC [Caloramator mitchellensis]
MGTVMFKGNKDGIIIQIMSNDLHNVKKEIFEKLLQGKDFFNGCNMYIRSDNELPAEFTEEIKNSLKNIYNANLIIEEKRIITSKKVTETNEGNAKIIKRTIRSGQRITFDGNIVIIGDVNSGAEVLATGSIIVLGVLRGIVHAGLEGNNKAFIAAYDLRPELIKIADLISRLPDDPEKNKIPEVARIKGRNIIIEPYLPNKIQ